MILREKIQIMDNIERVDIYNIEQETYRIMRGKVQRTIRNKILPLSREKIKMEKWIIFIILRKNHRILRGKIERELNVKQLICQNRKYR